MKYIPQFPTTATYVSLRGASSASKQSSTSAVSLRGASCATKQSLTTATGVPSLAVSLRGAFFATKQSPRKYKDSSAENAHRDIRRQRFIQIRQMLISNTKKSIHCILWLLVCSTVIISACSGFPAQATPTEEPSQIDEINPMVSVTGKVVPSQWSRLSINILGVVEEILVQEGEQVQKDQALLRLQGKEDLQAAIETARFEISAAQKALDDLYKNADTTRAAALEAIALRQKQYRDALYQLDNFTVPQPQSGMSTDEALVAMKEKLDQARAKFEPYKYYPSTNNTREDLKEDLDAAQADYNAAVKRLEYETELAVAEANLKKAKQDYLAWKDGPDPKEVTVAQARLNTANAALAAAESKLSDLELRAPFSGTISEINVRTGEWVTPEIPIFLIADLTNLQVETTDLNEIDAARVSVGDVVLLTFDALPAVEVQGIVKSIAPKAAEGSGVNYTAIIIMDEIPEALRWGMTAFADISVLSE